MDRSYLLLLIVIAASYSRSNAASYSMSCVYINGEQRCTSNDDPNGNRAGAAAGVYGNRGMVASGVGNPDHYNINHDQIGYDENTPSEDGNPNWNHNAQQFPVYGTNDAGGMAYAGPNNDNFPRFDLGDPFRFVQDFMKGKR